jgi:acyl-[acyl carrier protein]--UDP-N-acetylglucosamine O-acyltransferase
MAIFNGAVMSGPILINAAQWTAFTDCELGGGISFAVNNTFGGHVTVANSYAPGSVSIIGGSPNLHLSNNVNIT